MDKSKRYNEPKKLWDILKDMGMNAENINQKKTSEDTTKKTSANLERIMRISKKLIKQLDTIYQKATPLINSMDAYYIAEKKYLLQARRLVTEGKLRQQDITKIMQIITENLDYFELEYHNIDKSLRKIIKKFPYPSDQQEQNKKADELNDLFIDIYSDIENILMWYSKLLHKTSNKKSSEQ